MHYVLLPGLHGSARLFTPFILAAPEGATFRAVSYPLHGPQDYDTLAAVARAALPQNRPYVLVAESFSGPIGVRLAAEAPAGLQRLVLVATFVVSPVPRVLAKAPNWVYELLPMRTRWPRLALGGTRRADFDEVLREELAAVTVEVFRGRTKALLGVDARAGLRRVVAPVLYVEAVRDWVVGPWAGRVVRRVLPEVEVRTVVGPHLVLQRAPAAVWSALDSSSHPKAAS